MKNICETQETRIAPKNSNSYLPSLLHYHPSSKAFSKVKISPKEKKSYVNAYLWNLRKIVTDEPIFREGTDTNVGGWDLWMQGGKERVG